MRPTPKRWISGVLSSLFLATSLSAPAAPVVFGNGPSTKTAKDATSAANDDMALAKGGTRDFGTFRLANGLQVFLIHDELAKGSSAALSVGAGLLNDPPEMPGLAHYNEHMLFDGTQKYPKVNEYEDFIRENGGIANAFTIDGTTTFMFQIEDNVLAETLDRFSQFFKHPLFDKTYADHEVNAVNAEFEDHKRDDHWRAKTLQDLMSNPGHPLTQFHGGNRQTLVGDRQAALRAFFGKYYSADNMKLVIISSAPRKLLKQFVELYFSEIPSFPVEKPTIDHDFRTPLKDQYRLLQIKPLTNTRTLSMDFPTINLADHLDSKPEDVVSDILSSEAKGSLLARLKAENLASDISVEGSHEVPGIDRMSIDIDLTRSGEEQYEHVMEIVFAYIDMLKKQGVKEYTIKETQTRQRTGLKWDGPKRNMIEAATVANLMFDYKPSDVPTLPYIIQKFDPDAYQQVLATMTPANMLVSLMGKTAKTDKREPVFGTEYSYSQVGGAAFDRLAHPAPITGISYPEPDKSLDTNPTLVKEKPPLIADDAQAHVLAKFDTLYHTPKAYMTLELKTPRIYDSVTDYARAQLWNACLDEAMSAPAYSLEHDGIKYESQPTINGLVIEIGGYTTGIAEMAALLGQNLTSCKISEQQFSNIKDSVIGKIQDIGVSSSDEQASYYFGRIAQQTGYAPNDIVSALQTTSLKDLKDYARHFLARTKITGIAYGNWNDTESKKAFAALRKGIPGKTLTTEQDFNRPTPALARGENAIFSVEVPDNTSTLLYTLQSNDVSLKQRVALSIIAQLVRGDFFTQMRTEQGLSYTPQNGVMDTPKFLSLSFLIQSPTAGPEQLKKAIQLWLPQALTLVEKMSDEEFSGLKEAIAESIHGVPDNMEGRAAQLFEAVIEKDKDSDDKQDASNSLSGLTRQDVIALARQMFTDPQTPSLSIEIRSTDSGETAPAGAYSDVEKFRQRYNHAPGQ